MPQELFFLQKRKMKTVVLLKLLSPYLESDYQKINTVRLSLDQNLHLKSVEIWPQSAPNEKQASSGIL